MPKGGLATTRKGWRGSRSCEASAWTTPTGIPTNRRRSALALAGCNSTATTRAPVRTSASVSTPSPAPMSTTRSPGRTPAARTNWAAMDLFSRWNPHRVRGAADTAHHDHCHGSDPVSCRPRRRAVCRDVPLHERDNPSRAPVMKGPEGADGLPRLVDTAAATSSVTTHHRGLDSDLRQAYPD